MERVEALVEANSPVFAKLAWYSAAIFALPLGAFALATRAFGLNTIHAYDSWGTWPWKGLKGIETRNSEPRAGESLPSFS